MEGHRRPGLAGRGQGQGGLPMYRGCHAATQLRLQRSRSVLVCDTSGSTGNYYIVDARICRVHRHGLLHRDGNPPTPTRAKEEERQSRIKQRTKWVGIRRCQIQWLYGLVSGIACNYLLGCRPQSIHCWSFAMQGSERHQLELDCDEGLPLDGQAAAPRVGEVSA